MKRKLNVLGIFALMAMAFAFIFVSCQKDELGKGMNDNQAKGGSVSLATDYPLESTPVSGGGVTPWIIDGANRGGNRTCDEVAMHFETEFDFTSGKFDYEFNEEEGEWMWYDEDGNEYDKIPGVEVIVTDGTYVSFEVTLTGYCVGAVIVKGSNDANVYYYEDGVKEDSGLASPVNKGGNISELSNLTFCFVECENGEECIWEGETAYGGDTDFNVGEPGAWWFAFDTEGEETQSIYAGQKLVYGATVSYKNNQIIIVLGDYMKLKAGSETVKILGYESLPDSRPPSGGGPGSPRIYAGTDLIVDVAPYNFYVIHLDVEVCWNLMPTNN